MPILVCIFSNAISIAFSSAEYIDSKQSKTISDKNTKMFRWNLNNSAAKMAAEVEISLESSKDLKKNS